MKKRAMKKWIPKDTLYCYEYEDGKIKRVCKWWRIREDKDAQENGYCMYLKEGDWEGKGVSLLWDMCKECGEKDDV